MLLLMIVGAVFARAWSGDYLYDDRLLVTGNAALRAGDFAALTAQPFLRGGGEGYWRPLSMLGLWLGHAVGGAAGIHAIAWLAHLAATWFAWRIALRLLGEGPAPWMAALLFGLHPVQVEGVAWCSALSDPLCWCLGLAGLDAALRSRSAAAIGLCLLALLAKESAVLLVPLAVAARRAVQLPWRPTAIALLAAGAVWWLLRMLVFGSLAGGFGRGTVDPVAAARWPEAALELFGRELGLLVWPWPLMPFRTLDGSLGALGRAIAWIGALAVSFVIVRRGAVRWAPFALALVVASPLLAACLCPHLGGYPVADRYLGPSVLGASLLLVGARPGRWRLAVAAVLAVIAGTTSVLQIGVWRDQERLLAQGLAAAPTDPGLLVMMGNVLLERGDAGRARDAYRAALLPRADVPAGVEPTVVADAELGLAWCLLRTTPPDPHRAAKVFEQRAANGAGALAWIGVGVARGMLGEHVAAERALRHALELDPASSQAHYNLAFLLQLLGREDEARASAAAAVRSDPGNAAAVELLRRLGPASGR